MAVVVFLWSVESIRLLKNCINVHAKKWCINGLNRIRTKSESKQPSLRWKKFRQEFLRVRFWAGSFLKSTKNCINIQVGKTTEDLVRFRMYEFYLLNNTSSSTVEIVCIFNFTRDILSRLSKSRSTSRLWPWSCQNHFEWPRKIPCRTDRFKTFKTQNIWGKN